MNKLNETVSHLIDTYRDVSKIRNIELFSDFLINGYKMTTLSSVEEKHYNNVILAKMHLGMLITLYDDLADNPKFQDNELLEILYMLPFVEEDFIKNLSLEQIKIYELSKFLLNGLQRHLKDCPNYEVLKDFFHFDIEQIFTANKYSSLITQLPHGASSYESSRYGSFNMGIVAAGMIDLMGSEKFNINELGYSRSIFHSAQRMGRISNLIVTLDRELSEKDLTNELYIKFNYPMDEEDKDYSSIERQTLNEFNSLTKRILKHEKYIFHFSVKDYCEGINNLHKLHLSLKGII